MTEPDRRKIFRFGIAAGFFVVFIIVPGLFLSHFDTKQKTDRPVTAKVENTCEHLPQMSNADIIAETHLCEAAGLNAQSLACGNSYVIVQVQCQPRAQVISEETK